MQKYHRSTGVAIVIQSRIACKLKLPSTKSEVELWLVTIATSIDDSQSLARLSLSICSHKCSDVFVN